ncbi:hypothetical protein M9Y10_000599 [Tritrichomonas musculus]|uniref:NADAR domain-containing protein n=1 Tax=Tritrichomonas musculus TaxID=1915356 RepID=A0ABR2L4M8_9EUKA
MSQLPTQDIYSLEKLRQLWNEGARFQFVYFWQNTKEDVSKEEYNSSCCNQWFPSNFVDENGRMYNCCEQYMMAQKAIVFGDDETLQKILSEKNHSKIKKLGRIVKNYNQKIWNSKCQDIVFQGNLYKFTQNEKCRKFLLSVPQAHLIKSGVSDLVNNNQKQKIHSNGKGLITLVFKLLEFVIILYLILLKHDYNVCIPNLW